MKGFLLGLILSAAAFGGYMYWKQLNTHPVGQRRPTADAGASPREGHERKRHHRRGAARVARADGEGTGPPPDEAPEPVKLSPADLKLVSQGDDLSRPDVIHLGDATDQGGAHELTQEDIDGPFRAKEEAILGCIARSRPDEETYVPGRVTVKFRIQRAGSGRGIRVEGPAILQKGGLTPCIRGVLNTLRFPPSNGSQIVSYPFSLS
jgi:hypothetical protein